MVIVRFVFSFQLVLLVCKEDMVLGNRKVIYRIIVKKGDNKRLGDK